MRRFIIVLAAALCCVAAVAIVADAAPSRTQPHKPWVPKARKSTLVAAPVSDAAQVQSMGIEMPVTSEPTALDGTQAIARARQIMAFGQASDGVTASAQEVRFTMDRFQGALPNGVVPKDLLAWVITVDGQKWPGHGGFHTGTPPAFTEMNIVIDANTGAEVTEFAYK